MNHKQSPEQREMLRIIHFWFQLARAREEPMIGIWAGAVRVAVFDYLWHGTEYVRKNTPALVGKRRLSAYRFLFDDCCDIDLADLCDLYGPDVDKVRDLILKLAANYEQIPMGTHSHPEIQNSVDVSKKMDNNKGEGELTT